MLRLEGRRELNACNVVFAPKYSHAFASVAASAGLDVAAAQRQMQDFSASLDGSKDLREVMTDPSIPAEQKLAVLDAMAERIGMMREVRNFFAVIIDHQRLSSLHEILKCYAEVADSGQGIAEAEVVSAHELNEDDRRSLEEQVARLAGSRVRVAYTQDATLLGGAVVKIGSKVYDGSLRAQLEQMKQSLVAA